MHPQALRFLRRCAFLLSVLPFGACTHPRQPSPPALLPAAPLVPAPLRAGPITPSLLSPPAPVPPSSASAQRPLWRWTVSDFGGVLSVGLEGHRHFPSGRKHFRELCASCHALAGEGGGDATELTRPALTYSPEELLEKILSPDKHPPAHGGVLETLPQEGVLDLLAFILSGADSKSSLFFAP